MRLTQKKKLRQEFFRKLGHNAETFAALFDATERVAFNIKDAELRIIEMNRLNCAICNFKDKWEAIGSRSSDLFPKEYADAYMDLDREVLRTGRPVFDRITQYPADRSLHISVTTVYPLTDSDGKIIGVARVYYQADDPTERSRYGRLKELARYIESHYREPMTVSEMARRAGIPIGAFKTEFPKIFHMTPGRYLTTIRLNAARQLLETTDLHLPEIAERTGFFDQSHFSRIFKKERRLTPGKYRHIHRQ